MCSVELSISAGENNKSKNVRQRSSNLKATIEAQPRSSQNSQAGSYFLTTQTAPLID